MLKICCVGAGYVGGPTMAIVVYKCPDIQVAMVDISSSRIAARSSSSWPIFEPDLDDMSYRGRNLFFSIDIKKHIADVDIIFVSAADLTYWESAACLITDISTSDKIMVEKSIVPIKRILTHNSNDVHFQIQSNPKFLGGGITINNLLHPDRVLISGHSTPEGQAAINTLVSVYAHWSIEISKLAANAFLAQMLSSINAMCTLCEATSTDVTQVAYTVGKDSRVGHRFLNANVGYGGCYFQKDILNLVYICECNRLIESRFVKRIVSSMFNTVAPKKMAILGFTFKKDMGDAREMPAIDICQGLLRDNAHLRCVNTEHLLAPLLQGKIKHDLDMDNPDETHGRSKHINIVSDIYEATEGAHGICIMREWDEFKTLDYEHIFKHMQHALFIFDGQNMIDADRLCKMSFIVYSIGKPLDPWLRDLSVVPPSS
ncbi:hypothetical protein KP509_18G056500 [Ceratopteris richardii]|uniref:UDP-glucose 6-dehydrogenase n=1 Tax=Ceratopteris richardii TaxID=49495 RepID=A0A8T2SUD8_CERRI|nr:hypothetical protein KP509_18G056500 [Ceratopteris richardii]